MPTKTAPRRWCPSKSIATIKLRTLSQWDRVLETPNFETWAEAYAHMVATAADRLQRAKRELKSAERFGAKVQALKAPGEGG